VAIAPEQFQDLKVVQGLSSTVSLKLPADPTDWKISLEVRDRPGGLVYADLSLENGLELDVAKRVLKAMFTSDQTARFARVSVWTLLVTAPDAAPERLFYGHVYVRS
jgi:hypothetical protein